MKTVFKTITFLLLIATLFNCSNDDDVILPPTVQELLIGKWYFDISSFTLSDCDHKSSLNFMDDLNMKNEIFSDELGDCSLIEQTSYTYTLTNDQELNFTIVGGGSGGKYNIVSVSQTKLVLTQGSSGGVYILILKKSI